MNSLILIKLGQIYRMELLVARSLNELLKRRPAREISDALTKFADLHQNNLQNLTELFGDLNYTPGKDIEIPPKVQILLDKKDFPDRLLFSWLNELEIHIEEQYQRVTRLHERNPGGLPLPVWKKLEKVRHRQEQIASEVSDLTNITTDILNPTVWK